MKELNALSTTDVAGGVDALTIIAILDLAYDFFKGLMDGVESK